MAQESKITPLIVVFLVGAFAQVLFAAADCKDTPYRTAVSFSKAYFGLDEAMSGQMCNDGVTEEEVDLVRAYLQGKYDEAAARGYKMERLRNQLFHVQTRTLAQDDTSAKVHLSGTIQNGINPLFWYVGRRFHLTQPREIEETLNLVKEDGQWKVCGTPFSLSGFAEAG
jgi:hypothetical protein